jgi:hypothetical protein
MEFKKLCINGISYGEIGKGNPDYLKDEEMKDYCKVTNVDFRDKRLLNRLLDQYDEEYEYIRNTLFVVALCHTIITE